MKNPVEVIHLTFKTFLLTKFNIHTIVSSHGSVFNLFRSKLGNELGCLQNSKKKKKVF